MKLINLLIHEVWQMISTNPNALECGMQDVLASTMQ